MDYLNLPLYTRLVTKPKNLILRERTRLINNNKEINSILTSFTDDEIDFLKDFQFTRISVESREYHSLNFKESEKFNEDLSIIFVFCIESMQNYLAYGKFEPEIREHKVKKGPYINFPVYTEEEKYTIIVEHKIQLLLNLFLDLKQLKELCLGLVEVNEYHYKNMLCDLIDPYKNSMVNMVNFLKDNTGILDVENIGEGSLGITSILDKLRSGG